MIDIKKAIKTFKETKEGFDIIYNSVYNSLRFFVYKYVKDFSIADDIVSQTMLIVYDNIEKYDETKAELNTWIFSIAKNECLTYLKKSKRTVSLNNKVNDDDEFVDVIQPVNNTSSWLDEHRIQKVFNHIFKKIGYDTISGKILFMKYINKLSNVEIVEKINQPHLAEYNAMKVEYERTSSDDITKKMDLKRGLISFEKNSLINESFVKNNLKRTEKFLINEFKGVELENILYNENI